MLTPRKAFQLIMYQAVAHTIFFLTD